MRPASPEFIFEEPSGEGLPAQGVDDGPPLLEVLDVVDEGGVAEGVAGLTRLLVLARQVGPTRVLPVVPLQTTGTLQVAKVLAVGGTVTGVVTSVQLKGRTQSDKFLLLGALHYLLFTSYSLKSDLSH